ncbi:hypothetical protein LZ653_13065, partial [Hafnia paralvei]|uniref:hypothetical protein n=1 Tax=Hafnia paralvei TaxID=546367 RepID=UPI001F18EC47
ELVSICLGKTCSHCFKDILIFQLENIPFKYVHIVKVCAFYLVHFVLTNHAVSHPKHKLTLKIEPPIEQNTKRAMNRYGMMETTIRGGMYGLND